MIDPNVAWGTILAAAAAYETYGIFNRKNGDTLSERTRAWFHTNTKTGKAVFTVSWLAFSAWFLIHIIGG
jgi:hypothetical protein